MKTILGLPFIGELLMIVLVTAVGRATFIGCSWYSNVEWIRLEEAADSRQIEMWQAERDRYIDFKVNAPAVADSVNSPEHDTRRDAS